ncbi:MAG: hypothetical protein C5B55_09215 [Blastocatellia bacterium]|nr:MAG: hypothetical protein C5B55_09215 [Blastocatellia bacterium]
MKECPACKRCFPDEINHCPEDGDATNHTLLGEPTLDARYSLERRLGQGGMGVVFKARHIFLKTPHAIKVILPDLVGNDPMLLTRFRQEALAAAAIRHQNIIAVTDFGVARGSMPFLVMEFVQGKSLQDVLAQEGAMPPQRAWEIITAIAAGVGAAHRQKIVHRDLKPLNIMIQDDVPVAEGLKILDFGLAKIKSGELLGSFVQAKTSGLMGSPFYMAPEQWSDEEPDARADIYSLGIILYQMLAGDVPFKGSSIPSIMNKHLTLPPPSFQSRGVSVPPQIEAVVRHALEKEVAARIDSVPAFLKELHAAMNSAPALVTTKRDTGVLDPNKTVISGVTSTMNTPATTADDTNFGASFESMAGTVSYSVLEPELQKKLSDTAAAHKREHEEREQAALETKRVEAEKRRQEEELQRAREREQQEKLERMALQAKELEDRLERLAVSMPPDKTAIDPETTHVKHTVTGSAVGRISAQDLSLGSTSQSLAVEVAQKRSSAPVLLMVGGIVVLLLAVGGTAGYFVFRSRPQPTDVSVNKPPVDTTPTVKADLALIEGGTFEMGLNTGPSGQQPAHRVTVQTFSMDKTEVTNAEYADFVRDTNHAPPQTWNGTKPPFGQEQWPVVTVSFDDANAFATWRSKRDGVTYRLPTEEEWEYAARNGDQSDLFPWGKEWQDKVAVIKEAAPSPVGSRPAGKNRWGVSDLIGNVWEWTSSKVTAYPGNPTVVPESTREWITIRGACYVSDPANRDKPISSAMREFVPASTKTALLGFRLVRSGS